VSRAGYTVDIYRRWKASGIPRVEAFAQSIIDLADRGKNMRIERHTWNACDDLVEKFCGGDINEADFVERGLALGMPHDEITQIIDDVRAEDGV
jgi:hypothetical protein